MHPRVIVITKIKIVDLNDLIDIIILSLDSRSTQKHCTIKVKNVVKLNDME